MTGKKQRAEREREQARQLRLEELRREAREKANVDLQRVQAQDQEATGS